MTPSRSRYNDNNRISTLFEIVSHVSWYSFQSKSFNFIQTV